MVLSAACTLRNHGMLRHVPPLLRSTTLRWASTAAPARHSVSKNAARTSQPPSKLPSRTLPSAFAAIDGSLTATEKKQLYNAKRLLEAGVTRIYKAPRDWAFIIGSCTISSILFSMVYGFYLLGHFREDDPIVVHPAVKWTHRLLMPLLGGLGWWVLLRTGRRIYTVDLVSKTDRISMLVTLRRPFPLVRRKQLPTELSDFRIPSRVVEVPEVPAWADQPAVDTKTGILNRISTSFSKSIYNVFFSTRKIVSGQGVLDADIKGEGIFKLDISGDFHKNGQSLLSVVTIER